MNMKNDEKNIIENNNAEAELLEMLAESADDIKHGRVIPMEEAFDDIRAALKEGQS